MPFSSWPDGGGVGGAVGEADGGREELFVVHPAECLAPGADFFNRTASGSGHHSFSILPFAQGGALAAALEGYCWPGSRNSVPHLSHIFPQPLLPPLLLLLPPSCL